MSELGANESRRSEFELRRDPDFQDRKSLPTLRRSQLLRDLLITSGGVAGSNSRLWRSQARDFRAPKRFLHLFFCAIAQYLSFLRAIFRGLLQELRRPLR